MRDSNRQRGNSKKSNPQSSPTLGTKRASRDKGKGAKNKNGKGLVEKRERDSERETRARKDVSKTKLEVRKSKERKRQASHGDKDNGPSGSRAKKKERLVEAACIDMSDRKNAESSPRENADPPGQGGARDDVGQRERKERKESRERKERREQKDGQERKEDPSRARRADRTLDDGRADLGQPSMDSILRSLVQQGHPGSFGGPPMFFGHSFPAGSSSHQREKINSLIDMIESDGNVGEQLTGLSELCEHVSIASEDSMLSFPTDRVVPLLMDELQGSENPDVMLLAARAVTLLLDVYPPSARLVSQCGGVPVLCEKLLSIEYIDLAEQSIQALGKMSESYPELLLDPNQGNVLDAVLSFVDFFQIGMQRIAVATAANVCRAMASEGGQWPTTSWGGGATEDCVLDGLKAMCRGSIPILLQLTSSADNKIALSAYQALTSVAKTCSLAGLPVESVIDVDSLQVVMERLVAVGGAVQMKPCVFYAMVRFISMSASTSVELPKRLLAQQVPCVVSSILALLSTKAQASVSTSVAGIVSLQEFKPRDQEEANVLISLVDHMLPPVLGSDLRVFDRSKTKREMKTLERVGIVLRTEDSMRANRKKNLLSIRKELLQEGGCAAVDAVAPMLLDPLLHLEFTTLSRDSKLGVLSLVDKILFYSSPACLLKLVSELPLSVFIIRLLQSSNHVWPLSSLKFIASMLQKQPEMKKSMLREGVLHEVKKTKDTFLALGQAEKDLSAAYAWLADKVLVCSFGEHLKNLGGSEGVENETEGVLGLKKLRNDIAASTSDDERILHVIGDFLKLVLGREVSPYEIHASGILEDVYRYLRGGDTDDVASASRRRASFRGLLESPEATERVIDTIQEILMNSEHLQVVNSLTQAVPSLRSMLIGNAGFGAQNDARDMDSFRTGLQALGTPLRIKLRCRDDALHDRLSGTAILIEPLATVAQTMEYLRPKVARVLTSKVMESLKASRGQARGGVAGESIVTRSKSKRLGYLAGMGKSGDTIGGRKVLDQVDQRSPRSPTGDHAYLEDEEDMEDEEMLDELSDREGDEDVDMVGGEDVNIEVDDGSGSDGGLREGGGEDPQDGRLSGPMSRVDSAAGAGGEHNEFSIRLFLGGKELKSTDTLLRVIHAEKIKGYPRNSVLDMAHVWKETHQINFCIDLGDLEEFKDSNGMGAPVESDSKLEQILCNGKDPATSEALVDPQVYYAVYVLEVFEDVSSPELRPLLINSKICSKLTKQMSDPLLVCSRMLPDWCSRLPRLAKFLFSYDARRMYFRYHAFGLGRTVMAMLEDASLHGPSGGSQGSGRELPFRTPRVVRQKVRISRSHVLESSRKIFDRYADSKSRLEVEFYNEAGSGLGPTLEFYTLLSAEFQRRDLGMWREFELSTVALANISDEDSGIMEERPGPRAGELPVNKRSKELVVCPLGLFPKPIMAAQGNNAATTVILDNFRLLGQAAAKAIQDSRLLDIPLSRPFYKVILYGPGSLEREDLKDIDPAVFKTLWQMEQAILDAEESSLPTVLLGGVPIDDLCLSFVLPGDDAFELCPGGVDTAVTSQNVSRYVDCVFEALLDTGIRAQVAAFRQGFNRIFPLEHLEIFYEDEIEDILCGDSKEAWTPESLAVAIKCDHGYSSSSQPVVALINVLSSLEPIDKRRFLKFVTGAPRLPAGGFSSLKPKLTVVRKNPDVPIDASGNDAVADMTAGDLMSPRSMDHLVAVYADRDLPSVMTCANYLKLPPYSSVDVLRDRLLFSIREGQNSFDLS